MAKSRRRNLMHDEEGENFWPSFADLTSTIALIFFVLVLVAYIQNLLSGKQLDAVRRELQLSMRSLSAAKTKVQSSEAQLKLLAAQIEVGQAELRLSGDKLAAQEQVIATSNRELEGLRLRLQSISVLRVEVLEKVKQSIEAQLPQNTGRASPVAIADNGNIVINENLVFESNSYTIKSQAKPFLSTLSDAFTKVLADPSVREHIDVIVVQGHTDERGSVAYNRELSAKRANAVLDHMFALNPTLEASYGSYFASSAYSEFRPVRGEKNEGAYEQNRRIEISVVLRDASVRGLIDEYMRGVPVAAPGTP